MSHQNNSGNNAASQQQQQQQQSLFSMSSSSILFGGEDDVMDVDEAIPTAASSLSTTVPNNVPASAASSSVVTTNGSGQQPQQQLQHPSSLQQQQQQQQQQFAVASDALDATKIPGAAVSTVAISIAQQEQQLQQQPQYFELISKIILPSPYPQHNDSNSNNSGTENATTSNSNNTGTTSSSSGKTNKTGSGSTSASDGGGGQTSSSSSRFRNALQRVMAQPTTDVEAWIALMTEVSSCYQHTVDVVNIHSGTVECISQLDWIESCYGTMLRFYPYATQYAVLVADILYQQSARVGEEHGPTTRQRRRVNYGGVSSINNVPDSMNNSQDVTRRSLQCEAKLEYLLTKMLGHDAVQFDTPASKAAATANEADEYTTTVAAENNTTTTMTKTTNGMCVWCIELWLLYIKKCTRDATRRYSSSDNTTVTPSSLLNNNNSKSDDSEKIKRVRKATIDAYENAIKYAGYASKDNHLLWHQYIQYVKSWTTTPSTADATTGANKMMNGIMGIGGIAALDKTTTSIMLPTGGTSTPGVVDHALAQEQMIQLRSIYQRCITHPMMGLDQMWSEYETFERKHSEALAQALLAEYTPKYQHAKTVFLERNRIYHVNDLQLGRRLATTPVMERRDATRLALPSMTPASAAAAAAAATTSTNNTGGSLSSSTNNPMDAAGINNPSLMGGGRTPKGTKAGNEDDEGEDEDDGDIEDDTDEVAAKRTEEDQLLRLWKVRCSYERTNPERLSNMEYISRMRVTWKEMVSVLTRHPESWYMWSTWEQQQQPQQQQQQLAKNTNGKKENGTTINSTNNNANAGGTTTTMIIPWQSAVSVLRLGQQHIPDCTILAHAETQIIELFRGSDEDYNDHHNDDTNNDRSSTSSSSSCAEACVIVMERFVRRCPSTLGFVLYQQIVRRHYGMHAARAVFARARRTLIDVDANRRLSRRLKRGRRKPGDGDDNFDKDHAGEGDDDDANANKPATNDNDDERDSSAMTRRWMVTNRLDLSIGQQRRNARSSSKKSTTTSAGAGEDKVKQDDRTGRGRPMTRTTMMIMMINGSNNNSDSGCSDREIGLSDDAMTRYSPGPITWHLYASHATIEHRINRSPVTAARVYELGLRKHGSFLTLPQYVTRYAQLLLELGDVMNLRALLARSIAACEELGGETRSTAAALAVLWDARLYFESILCCRGSSDDTSSSTSSSSGIQTLHSVERKRREAVLGPDVEDVATGGYVGQMVGQQQPPLIGAQKTTIAEHLLRVEGYDASSSIVNGMSRAVDLLGMMGVWGNDDYHYHHHFGGGGRARAKHHQPSTALRDIDFPGGRSDASYYKRVQFQRLTSSGLSADAAIVERAGSSAAAAANSKIMSARERIQQSAAAVAAAEGQQASSAMMMAIQQSPDWLRPLLLLLPASRLRLPIVAKPPPHLTEMALTSLRQNVLPLERPDDDPRYRGGVKKRPVSMMMNNDSSDDEGGSSARGGYGNQFRARQRARMITSSQSQQQRPNDSSK